MPRNAKKVGLSKYAGRFAASSTLIPGTTARSSGAGRGVADGDSRVPVCRSTPPLPWVLPVGATIHPGGAVGHHADAEPRLSSDHLNRLLGQGPKAGARVCGVGKLEDQDAHHDELRFPGAEQLKIRLRRPASNQEVRELRAVSKMRIWSQFC